MANMCLPFEEEEVTNPDRSAIFSRAKERAGFVCQPAATTSNNSTVESVKEEEDSESAAGSSRRHAAAGSATAGGGSSPFRLSLNLFGKNDQKKSSLSTLDGSTKILFKEMQAKMHQHLGNKVAQVS